jgi:hypothetical protein
MADQASQIGTLAIATLAMGATIGECAWSWSLDDLVDFDIAHGGVLNGLSLVLALTAAVALVRSIQSLRTRRTGWAFAALAVTMVNLGIIGFDAFVWNFLVWG